MYLSRNTIAAVNYLHKMALLMDKNKDKELLQKGRK